MLGDEGARPEALTRYFRPGVNWAGRSLYGIPVFGFLLLALSHGAYSLRDGWVMSGLFIFVVMVLARRRRALAGRAQAPGFRWSPCSRAGALVPARRSRRDRAGDGALRHRGLVLLVVGSVLMVVQP